MSRVRSGALALDGVYVRDEHDGTLRFEPLGAPTADDVAEVATWTHARLVKILARHGRCLDGPDDAADTLVDEPRCSSLRSCAPCGARVVLRGVGGGLQLLGAEPGARTSKLSRPVALRTGKAGAAVAQVGGVDVHATVLVDGRQVVVAEENGLRVPFSPCPPRSLRPVGASSVSARTRTSPRSSKRSSEASACKRRSSAWRTTPKVTLG
jgi:hypothetical protein